MSPHQDAFELLEVGDKERPDQRRGRDPTRGEAELRVTAGRGVEGWAEEEEDGVRVWGGRERDLSSVNDVQIL